MVARDAAHHDRPVRESTSIPPVVAATLAAPYGPESIGIYLGAMGVLSLGCVFLMSGRRATALDREAYEAREALTTAVPL